MNQPDDFLPKERIYQARAIWLGAFLGGPLVAGYLIAENFKVLKEPEKVKKTWVSTLIITVAIISGLFLIPDPNKISPLSVSFSFTIIAVLIVHHYQAKQITSHLIAGGLTFSWRRTFALSLLGSGMTLLSFAGIALLFEAVTGKDTKNYGLLENEISYNNKNISEAEVDRLAAAFSSTYFFDDDAKKWAFVKKVNNGYEVSLICDCLTGDSNNLLPMIQFRNDLQALFPDHKIVLNLAVDDYENVVKRLE